MNLHHANGEPDWAPVPSKDRNIWQRVAAGTNGLVTPGNAISVVGFLLVLTGATAVLLRQLLLAFWCIVVGRLADLADGVVADRTGTKSPLGEAVDATLDKLGVLGVVIAFGFGHILAWWALCLVVVQNGTTSIIAYLCRKRRLHVQPSRTGKWATACLWLAFFGFLLAAASGRSWLWPAYISLIVALALGAMATIGYALPLLSRSPPVSTQPR
jgi:phosphatidylglycerophosphate synthase